MEMDNFPCDELGCKRVKCYQFTNAFLCYGKHKPNIYGDKIRECYARYDEDMPSEEGKILDVIDMNEEEAKMKIEGLQEVLNSL